MSLKEVGNVKSRTKEEYVMLATIYVENYGILNYSVRGNKLVYNVSYPAYLSNPRYTIQHIVNLDTMQEQTKRLQRFDTKGLANLH